MQLYIEILQYMVDNGASSNIKIQRAFPDDPPNKVNLAINVLLDRGLLAVTNWHKHHAVSLYAIYAVQLGAKAFIDGYIAGETTREDDPTVSELLAATVEVFGDDHTLYIPTDGKGVYVCKGSADVVVASFDTPTEFLTIAGIMAQYMQKHDGDLSMILEDLLATKYAKAKFLWEEPNG